MKCLLLVSVICSIIAFSYSDKVPLTKDIPKSSLGANGPIPKDVPLTKDIPKSSLGANVPIPNGAKVFGLHKDDRGMFSWIPIVGPMVDQIFEFALQAANGATNVASGLTGGIIPPNMLAGFSQGG